MHPMSSLGTVISCDCWLEAGWLRDWLEVRSCEPANAANAERSKNLYTLLFLVTNEN